MRRDDRSTDELVAAYVDGVTELTADERRRVEARMAEPSIRDDAAATRDLIGQLRELPPAGNEPDWTALEHSIRDAVGPEVPRAWWRRWRWVVPSLALATTAVIVLFVVTRDHAPIASVPPIAHEPERHEPAALATERVALYLDGDDLEIEAGFEDVLDDPLDGLDDPDLVDGFLIPSDLAWVDELDDEALEHLEGWLEHPRSKG
jgi:hypothetical protein